MDRRQFIKWGSFLTVSTAALGLGACGSDDDDDDRGGAGGAGGDGGDTTAYTYPQGVASGDPRPDSIILWTRLEGAASDASVKVTVQVASDEHFANLLVDEAITAEPDWDYTVRHKVQGLQAGSTYYYRFLAGSTATVTGRTRTAPASGASVDQLKFAFISCQDWSVNHWAAFDALLEQDLDFIVHLGDYVYETVGAEFQSGAAESAHGALTLPDGTLRESDGAHYATTLADYRYLYKQYRSDARLQALHARFPFITIWDDHEFSDDSWGDNETYDTEGTTGTPQLERRRHANQAWFEFMPADVTLDLADPSFTNIQIYRAFAFGDLATLVMTDERLYRADHVIPESAVDSSVGSRYFVPTQQLSALESAKIQGAGGNLTPVSMLGDTQRAWWKSQMRQSTATWKLWGNEVSLLRMGFNGAQAVASLGARQLAAALGAMLGTAIPDALTQAMQQALAADLAAADTSTGYPVSDYGNLAALLQAQAGISNAVFAAAVKPSLDSVVARIPAALLGEFVLNADQWDGYNAERKDLMAFLQANSIQNVVALTGDIHSFYAGSVMADYDAESPEPVMVDLVTAGVSSDSFFTYFKNVVDTDDSFSAAKSLIYTTDDEGNIVNTFTDTLLQFNSAWMTYADTDAQGFAVVTLTRDALSCTFSKMNKLEGASAPAEAVGSQVKLQVTAGSPLVAVLSS